MKPKVGQREIMGLTHRNDWDKASFEVYQKARELVNKALSQMEGKKTEGSYLKTLIDTMYKIDTAAYILMNIAKPKDVEADESKQTPLADYLNGIVEDHISTFEKISEIPAGKIENELAGYVSEEDYKEAIAKKEEYETIIQAYEDSRKNKEQT